MSKFNREHCYSQTVGVEIEMTNISRSHAAEVVAEVYGGCTVQYVGGRYDKWTCTIPDGRKYSFVSDSSVYIIGEGMAEMNTPVLTIADLPMLRKVVMALKNAGALSSQYYGCGVHIHIGKGDHTPATLKNLQNTVAAHENLLIRAIGISPARYGYGGYCARSNKDFVNGLSHLSGKELTWEKLEDCWYSAHGQERWDEAKRHQHYNPSRYHMLNFHSVFTKGTVEFRMFEFERNTGLDVDALDAWIYLCLHISEKAYESKSCTAKELESDNDRYTMRVWLLGMGFIGDETATARNYYNTRLSGNCAWRGGEEQMREVLARNSSASETNIISEEEWNQLTNAG